jgi:S-(hydroxymethyl)glutathione dehydrogenase/alcohol dehydrogenase
MRAAVFVGVDTPMEVEDVTPVGPGPTDVVVQVDGSGVCHTDVAILHGDLPWPAPAILGHEATGIVVDVGPAVTRVKVGDRVVGAGIPACGDCFFCLRDQAHLCEKTFTMSGEARARRADATTMNAFAALGAFAEVMTVDQIKVVPVETDLPVDQLALIGCAVTTGVGAALNTARVTPGATVTVVGCGGVGQCVVQGARIAGAARIFAVDPVPLKRDAAAAQGATDLIDPADGDPVQQVRERTQGRGTDFSFEVVGTPATITTAYRAARRGGVVVVVGMPAVDHTLTLPAAELFLDGKETRYCVSGGAQVRRDIPRFIALAEAGRLDLESIVSQRIGVSDVNDAVAAMEAGKVVRSVITRWD